MGEDTVYSPVFKSGTNVKLGDGLFSTNDIDASRYVSMPGSTASKDGLGMVGSIFGEEGYFGNLNKDLAGVGGFDGLGQIAGLGADVFGIVNQNKALKQAKTAWEAENARANEVMAMNKEKYETFKADKAKLNAGY